MRCFISAGCLIVTDLAIEYANALADEGTPPERDHARPLPTSRAPATIKQRPVNVRPRSAGVVQVVQEMVNVNPQRGC